MMAVLGRETNLLLSLSFSAPCTVSFLPHIALRLGFPSWLPNVFLYKQDKRAEGKGMSFVCWCHKLMWTLPALDIVCLVVYTPRVLGITKAQNVIRHPSSARGCIHSSEIPFAIKPWITRIGAVSHVVSLYTKLEFTAFSRVVLRFVLSPVYSLHLSRYWVFWSFSCSIICLPFRVWSLQRWLV